MAAELRAQDLRDVHTHLDVAVEVASDVLLPISRVIGTSKAIGAFVGAPGRWIEAPVERHSLDRVQRALHFDFAIDDG
jgi:hypothetical protein